MKIFNIYCDESCHLENDHQQVMVLGAIWCPEDHSRSIEKSHSEFVRMWKTYRPWKGQQQRRINISIDNFSYIVVIAENRKALISLQLTVWKKQIVEKSSERNLSRF